MMPFHVYFPENRDLCLDFIRLFFLPHFLLTPCYPSFVLLRIGDQYLIFITSLSVSSSCRSCSHGQLRWGSSDPPPAAASSLQKLTLPQRTGVLQERGDLKSAILQMKDRPLHKSIITIFSISTLPVKAFSPFEKKMKSWQCYRAGRHFTFLVLVRREKKMLVT